MWLIEFKKRLEDALQALLWRQWSQLGVLGAVEAASQTLIDPEALLLFTLEAARAEPRLFDEVLDWLLANGGAIDVQRLRNIVRHDADYPVRLLAAVGSLMASREPSAKWKRLAAIQNGAPEPEPLFLLGDAPSPPKLRTQDETFAKAGYLRSPFKPRGLSRPVPPRTHAGLRFRLRGLFGIGIRAEAVAYLLTHEDGHANEIAQAICYSFPGVRQVLREMATSGTLHVRRKGREKRYGMEKQRWREFLEGTRPKTDGEPTDPEAHPRSSQRWMDWVGLFRSFAILLRFSRSKEMRTATEYVQISEFRQLLGRMSRDLEPAVQGPSTSDRRLDAESVLAAVEGM